MTVLNERGATILFAVTAVAVAGAQVRVKANRWLTGMKPESCSWARL
jgi:hypothetical protein